MMEDLVRQTISLFLEMNILLLLDGSVVWRIFLQVRCKLQIIKAIML